MKQLKYHFSRTNPFTKMRNHLANGIIAVAVAILLCSCMQMAIRSENWKSQDIYGRAIDQYGVPIVDAVIEGNLILNDGTYGGFRTKKYTTVTDSNGFFEITGINGASLNVLISKNGYKMGERGEGYKTPVSGRASPTDRVILTMWKIHGSEPLVHLKMAVDLTAEGGFIPCDTSTGKQTPDGDLKVGFSRFPSKRMPGLVHPYDWQFKIEMVKGGLVPENDPYPYWAPETGYKTAFGFEMSSNCVPWRNQFDQTFYIKNSAGQYGLMKVLVFSATTPPTAQINFTINPSGSQNLEPDFPKQ